MSTACSSGIDFYTASLLKRRETYPGNELAYPPLDTGILNWDAVGMLFSVNLLS